MHSLLKRYIPLADMLTATLGEDCEVVLHDLADPEHSVVYVANGRVTGRRIGQGIEHLVREVMQSEGPEQDYAVNDYFHHHGRLIRSSSLFIRDEENCLIGAMCINLDTTKITQQITFLQSLLPKPPESSIAHKHKNVNRVEDMVASLVDNILDGCDTRLMTREERMEKIRFMKERGIFQVKGSIEQVAKRLGITKVTVHSYLDELRKIK